MQVNFNFFQPGNRFFSVVGSNRLAQNSTDPQRGEGGIANAKRHDRVTLSPQGKMMNAIQSLQKQKQAIFDQRKELVSRTLEGGGDLKSIQEQLDSYQEQVEGIEKQIAQLTTNMAKQAVEEQTGKKSKKADPSKDAEEVETERLTMLANVSDSVKQTETVASVKRRMEGDARVKESEIEMGALRIEALTDKAKDGANVHRMVKNAQKQLDAKQLEVDKLEELSRSLEETQGKRNQDAAEQLEEE